MKQDNIQRKRQKYKKKEDETARWKDTFPRTI